MYRNDDAPSWIENIEALDEILKPWILYSQWL